MPQAAVLAVATWVSTAVATVAAPLAVFGAALPSTIGTFAGSFVATLGGAAGLGAAVGAWVQVGGLAMTSFNRPKAQSTQGNGVLLSKLDGQLAPIPIVYGRTATGGSVVYRQAYGGTGKNEHLTTINVLSVGPIEGWESSWANDQKLNWSGDPHLGLVDCTGVDGAEADSKLYKSSLKLAFRYGWRPDGASQFHIDPTMPLYTADSKLSGLANIGSICIYNTDAFPQGPMRSFYHVVKGVPCYDPRKDSTYPGGSGSHRWDDWATHEFTENPALHALDWLKGQFENGEKVYGVGARRESIDVASFVEAANVCDSNEWKGGGVFTTADSKFAVLNTLLQAAGAVAVARGSQFSCLVNAPMVATYTITRDDIVGNVEVTNRTSIADTLNAVDPMYRNEGSLWKQVPGQRVTAQLYVDNDGGDVRTREIVYGAVQQAKQAGQLAAYDLLNSREFLTFDIVCGTSMEGLEAGHAVLLDIPEIAIADEEGLKGLVISKTWDWKTQQTRFTIRTERDSKHDWALGRTDVPPDDPSLGGYDPSNPPAPNATWAITGNYIEGAEGEKIPGLVIEGECDNPYATEVIIEVARAQTDEGADIADADLVWINAATGPKDTVKFNIAPLEGGRSYWVNVRYKTIDAVITPPLRLGPQTTHALTIPWTPNVIVDGPINPDGSLDANASVWWDGLTRRVVGETLAEQAITLALHNEKIANVVTFDDVANAVTDAFEEFEEIANIGTLVAEAHANAVSANGSAQSAILHANYAVANASAAASSAGAAEGHKLIALSARQDANDFANAALIHTSNAQSFASDSEDWATVAETFASAAETDSAAALGYRNDAQSASSTATSASSTATTQAGLATTAKNTAESAATAAQGYRNQAQSYADDAGEWANAAEDHSVSAATNAGLAQGYMSIAASSATGSLNKNAMFADWTGGSGTLPANWSNYSSGTSNTRQSVAGPSPYGFRQSASGTMGISQSSSSDQIAQLGPGYYVIEADIILNSGSLSGAGVQVSHASGTATLNFATDKDISGTVRGAGSAGNTYRWRHPFQVTATGTTTLYLQSGTGSGSRNITWLRCSVSPRVEAIAMQGVETTVNGMTANVTSIMTTLDGIEGKWTLNVTGGNRTVGIQAIANSTTADLRLTAQNVYFVDTSNNGSVPLAVTAGNVYIPNVIYVGSAQKIAIDGTNNRILIQD